MVRDGPQVGVAAAALWRLTENTVLQMKDSLINLQNGIRSLDYTAESDEKRNRYH